MEFTRKTTYQNVPEQRKSWEMMKALLANRDLADSNYDALDGAEEGKVISTDVARYLDTRYAKTRKGELRDIVPGWDLAWRYAEDRLARELKKKGKGKLFRLMAGGWAAGKTHAVSHLPFKPDLIWDGTLSKPIWAATHIDYALAKKWKVEIVYIYRNLELALYGVIQRAVEVGRTVPLKDLPKSHRDAQQSVLELSLLFGTALSHQVVSHPVSRRRSYPLLHHHYSV